MGCSNLTEWMTWPQAAQFVGCPVSTIETYVRAGRIHRRADRRQPSLKRESVEEFVHRPQASLLLVSVVRFKNNWSLAWDREPPKSRDGRKPRTTT